MIKLLKKVIGEYEGIIDLIKDNKNVHPHHLIIELEKRNADEGVCYYLYWNHKDNSECSPLKILIGQETREGFGRTYLDITPNRCISYKQILEVTEKRLSFLKELLIKMEG